MNECRRDGCNSFVVDGFPRLRRSSLFLEGGAWCIVRAIHLKIDDESLLLERVSGRLLNSESGMPFHSTHNPPPPGVSTVNRAEDTLESLKARLYDWHHDTLPLVEQFGKRNQLSVKIFVF